MMTPDQTVDATERLNRMLMDGIATHNDEVVRLTKLLRGTVKIAERELIDETTSAEDSAYNRAVQDVVKSLRAYLAESGVYQ